MSANTTTTENARDPEKAEGGIPKVAPVVLYRPVKEPDVIRGYVSEPTFLIGAQYAILLQFCHPGLARGSLEHSDFASRILNRLVTTSRFLNVAVFGTPEERKLIFSVIHRKHAAVKGDGYYADDPELHKWTAATLFVSILRVHEEIWGKGKLAKWKVEAIFRESSVYATSLRMPTEMWPKTLDEFWAYWNHNIETLEITHWAKELMRALLWPKVPFPLSTAAPLMRLWTIALLPERVRNEYGLPWTKREQRLYKMTMRPFAFTYRLVPSPIRRVGIKFGVWEMRSAAKRIEKTGTWTR